MMTLIYILAIIPPIVIVCLWKRRPVLAFLTASLFLFIGWTAPDIIEEVELMRSFGLNETGFMTAIIFKSVVETTFLMFIGLPVLAIIQWIARRNYKRAQKQKASKDVFL